jgi:hypothetical protein
MQGDDPYQRDNDGPISDPIQTATEEPTTITVFEHHDADGAHLDVAVVRPDRWHFLNVDEARELADKLLDAADVAEEYSEEFDVPLRTR